MNQVGGKIACGLDYCNPKTEYCDKVADDCGSCHYACSISNEVFVNICKDHCPYYLNQQNPGENVPTTSPSPATSIQEFTFGSYTYILIIVSIILIALVVISIGIYFCWRRRKAKRKQESQNVEDGANDSEMQDSNPEEISLLIDSKSKEDHSRGDGVDKTDKGSVKSSTKKTRISSSETQVSFLPQCDRTSSSKSSSRQMKQKKETHDSSTSTRLDLESQTVKNVVKAMSDKATLDDSLDGRITPEPQPGPSHVKDEYDRTRAGNPIASPQSGSDHSAEFLIGPSQHVRLPMVRSKRPIPGSGPGLGRVQPGFVKVDSGHGDSFIEHVEQAPSEENSDSNYEDDSYLSESASMRDREAENFEYMLASGSEESISLPPDNETVSEFSVDLQQARSDRDQSGIGSNNSHIIESQGSMAMDSQQLKSIVTSLPRTEDTGERSDENEETRLKEGMETFVEHHVGSGMTNGANGYAHLSGVTSGIDDIDGGSLAGTNQNSAQVKPEHVDDSPEILSVPVRESTHESDTELVSEEQKREMFSHPIPAFKTSPELSNDQDCHSTGRSTNSTSGVFSLPHVKPGEENTQQDLGAWAMPMAQLDLCENEPEQPNLRPGVEIYTKDSERDSGAESNSMSSIAAAVILSEPDLEPVYSEEQKVVMREFDRVAWLEELSVGSDGWHVVFNRDKIDEQDVVSFINEMKKNNNIESRFHVEPSSEGNLMLGGGPIVSSDTIGTKSATTGLRKASLGIPFKVGLQRCRGKIYFTTVSHCREATPFILQGQPCYIEKDEAIGKCIFHYQSSQSDIKDSASPVLIDTAVIEIYPQFHCRIQTIDQVTMFNKKLTQLAEDIRNGTHSERGQYRRQRNLVYGKINVCLKMNIPDFGVCQVIKLTPMQEQFCVGEMGDCGCIVTGHKEEAEERAHASQDNQSNVLTGFGSIFMIHQSGKYVVFQPMYEMMKYVKALFLLGPDIDRHSISYQDVRSVEIEVYPSSSNQRQSLQNQFERKSRERQISNGHASIVN